MFDAAHQTRAEHSSAPEFIRTRALRPLHNQNAQLSHRQGGARLLTRIACPANESPLHSLCGREKPSFSRKGGGREKRGFLQNDPKRGVASAIRDEHMRVVASPPSSLLLPRSAPPTRARYYARATA